MYFIDTNGYPPNKLIYKSLRELYTEIYQHKFIDSMNYLGLWDTNNYSGACAECLVNNEDNQESDWRCSCDDRQYLGIKMVKYISPETLEQKEEIINSLYILDEWNTKLSPLPNSANGFIMYTMLSNLYDHFILNKREITNYKSIEYLCFGYERSSYLLKHGIKSFNPDKRKYCDMYYPGTTDIIESLDLYYLYNGNGKFTDYYAILLKEPVNFSEVRVNTI